MIKSLKNIVVDGSSDKSILIDVTLRKNKKNKQVVVFCHGFKGFKDWGPFNKIANHFSMHDIVFVKFNFSHNGTTISNPTNFCDLKAFGNNNFIKELDDLGLVLNWLKNSKELEGEIDNSNISLFGHSRGGSIAMLKAGEDNRIKKIISWASPSNFLDGLPKGKKLAKWKELGLVYIYNTRTKQNMPMYFQFYESCIKYSNRLNIQETICRMNIPHLLVHGSMDTNVQLNDANNIKSWNINTNLHIIEGANHVFGGFHPYDLDKFPNDLQEAIDVTIKFLKG